MSDCIAMPLLFEACLHAWNKLKVESKNKYVNISDGGKNYIFQAIPMVLFSNGRSGNTVFNYSIGWLNAKVNRIRKNQHNRLKQLMYCHLYFVASSVPIGNVSGKLKRFRKRFRIFYCHNIFYSETK